MTSALLINFDFRLGDIIFGSCVNFFPWPLRAITRWESRIQRRCRKNTFLQIAPLVNDGHVHPCARLHYYGFSKGHALMPLRGTRKGRLSNTFEKLGM